MQRNVLTDIKPQIFHEMMRVYGKELNAWVYQELRRRIPDIQEDFMEKCSSILRTRNTALWKKDFTRCPLSGNKMGI